MDLMFCTLLEASLMAFMAASSKLFSEPEMTSMTLIIFMLFYFKVPLFFNALPGPPGRFVSLTLWTVLFVHLFLDLPIDMAEYDVDQNDQQGEQAKFHQFGGGGQTTGPGAAPNRCRGGKSLDLVLDLQDDPGTQKSNTCHDLSKHPGDIDIFTPLKIQGDQYKGTGTQGHQSVGFQPGTFSLVLPLQTDKYPCQGGQANLKGKVQDHCRIQSEYIGHGT